MKARQRRWSFITDSLALIQFVCAARATPGLVSVLVETHDPYMLIRHNSGKPAYCVYTKHSQTTEVTRLTVTHIGNASSAAWRKWRAIRFLLVVYLVRPAAHLYTTVTARAVTSDSGDRGYNVYWRKEEEIIKACDLSRMSSWNQAFDFSSTSHARKTWVQRCLLTWRTAACVVKDNRHTQ